MSTADYAACKALIQAAIEAHIAGHFMPDGVHIDEVTTHNADTVARGQPIRSTAAYGSIDIGSDCLPFEWHFDGPGAGDLVLGRIVNPDPRWGAS